MKKLFLVLVTFAFAGSASAFGLGLGIEARLDAGWDSLPCYDATPAEFPAAAASGLRAGGTVALLLDFGGFGIGLDSTGLVGPMFGSSFDLWLDTEVGAFLRVGNADTFAVDAGAGMRSFCLASTFEWETILYAEARIIISRSFSLTFDMPLAVEVFVPRVIAGFRF